METLTKLSFTLIAIVAFTFTSCSTDDDAEDTGNASEGTITANVNGVSFSSTPIATSATSVTTNGITQVALVGAALSNGNSRSFAIQLISIDSEGTYQIGLMEDTGIIPVVATYTEASGDSSGNAETISWLAPFDDTIAGELNIAEFTDNKIRGTFNFTAKNAEDPSNEIVVTEGSFNINF